MPIPFGEVLVEPVRNGIYKPPEFHGSGSMIVNMGELFAYPRLRAVPMKRVELSDSERERFSLKVGDLLFARRSLTAEGAGKCSVVLELDGPTTFESSIIRARPDQRRVSPQFLYYFFCSPLGVHLLDTIRRHVAVAGITGADLSRLEIPLPPLEEQARIAHVLTALDDKADLNRRMCGTLEGMARALFKSWFVDFDPVRAKAEGRATGLPRHIDELFPQEFEGSELGEVPVGWEPGSLGDIAELNPEAWSSDTRPEVMRYLDLSNTKWGRIEEVTTHLRENAPSRAQRVLRSRDTIVGTVRPGNGSYALISREGLTGSTGFAVLRPQVPEYAEFVYLAATAPANIEALAHLADGGAYPAVRPEVVAATPVVIPDAKCRAAFSRIVRPWLDRVARCDQESSGLGVLRTVVLPELISGHLKASHSDRPVAEASV